MPGMPPAAGETQPGVPGGDGKRAGVDFFVSHVSADQVWAEWVAWTLEDAGYRVLLQAWDFLPGSHVVHELQEATRRSARTAAVMSDSYTRSTYATAEWAQAWSGDPAGRARKLLVLRVEDCVVPGLLSDVVPVDLFGVEQAVARGRLLAAARGGRRKPASEPVPPASDPVPPTSDPIRIDRDEPAYPPALPAVWNLEARRRWFSGRNDELARLRDLLGRVPHRPAAVALHGVGGVGKSALAAEFAYRNADDYDLVWWVPAHDPTLLAERMARLADRLGLAGGGEAAGKAGRAVEELARRGRWMLVFDDAENQRMLRSWLPPGGAGTVLVTSRDSVWDEVAIPFPVGPLDTASAIVFLRRRLPALSAAGAERLSDATGALPLALVQAVGTITETATTVDRFVELLAAAERDVLDDEPPGDYPMSLAASWAVSLRRLERDSPLAARLLDVAAFFAAEPIPRAVLAGLDQSPDGGALVFGRALGKIRRYGLANVLPESVQLHRLHQLIIRAEMTREYAERCRADAARQLGENQPGEPGNPSAWPAYSVLLPHVLAMRLADSEVPAARHLLVDVAEYLARSGDLRAGLATAAETATAMTRVWGADHLDSLRAVRVHTGLCLVAGRHREARALGEELLDRSRRVLGEDHPETLRAAAGLAASLYQSGGFQAARALRADVLDRYRRVLGEDHPDTLRAATGLAVDLFVAGETAAARALRADVLDRYRRVLGEDHPDTLRAAANVAVSLFEAGETAAARELRADVLARRRRVLGEDHPDTLRTAVALATSLFEAGELARARDLAADALARYRRVLGEDHPDTLRAASGVAVDLAAAGESAAARALRADVLDRYRRLLGDEHPETVGAAQALAVSWGDAEADGDVEADGDAGRTDAPGA